MKTKKFQLYSSKIMPARPEKHRDIRCVYHYTTVTVQLANAKLSSGTTDPTFWGFPCFLYISGVLFHCYMLTENNRGKHCFLTVPI